MRRHFIIPIAILLFFSNYSFSQHEIGLSAGASNFLGDLGGANKIGTLSYIDVDPKLTKPSAAVFYKYRFTGKWAFKSSFQYLSVAGDDKLTQGVSPNEPQWFRQYRNLNFKSTIWEISALVEYNLFNFSSNRRTKNWSPYLTAGVGGFYFNPKTRDGNIALQPLGTEGQGMTGKPKKYNRVQPNVQIGFGALFSISKHLNLGFDLVHRVTFTDYIDDVSTNYVSQQDFIDMYGSEQGNYIYTLSRRSLELDPEETYGYVTAAGQQRGDPKNKDQYFTFQLHLSYVFLRSDYRCYYK